jgi:hypothetical protein
VRYVRNGRLLSIVVFGDFSNWQHAMLCQGLGSMANSSHSRQRQTEEIALLTVLVRKNKMTSPVLCLMVQRNNEPLCVAGGENMSLLTAIVSGVASGDSPASIYVAGMQDLPNERIAHVYWQHETPLSDGEQLNFTFLESSNPSMPIEVKPTDSPEYIQEQQEFEELRKSWVPPDEPLPNLWPNLAFELRLRDEEPIRAHLSEEHSNILCSIHWNKWRPEQCKIYVRTFPAYTDSSQRETTDWLRKTLLPGDFIGIRIHARSLNDELLSV